MSVVRERIAIVAQGVAQAQVQVVGALLCLFSFLGFCAVCACVLWPIRGGESDLRLRQLEVEKMMTKRTDLTGIWKLKLRKEVRKKEEEEAKQLERWKEERKKESEHNLN